MFNNWITGLAMLLISMPARSVSLDTLQAFSWSNRLILAFVDAQESERYREQLENTLADVDDRHIIWFVISERQLQTNYSGETGPDLHASLTRQWMDRSVARPQVVLIGKDGDEKLRSDSLDLLTIFDVIDQMPMRQYEMELQREAN